LRLRQLLRRRPQVRRLDVQLLLRRFTADVRLHQSGRLLRTELRLWQLLRTVVWLRVWRLVRLRRLLRAVVRLQQRLLRQWSAFGRLWFVFVLEPIVWLHRLRPRGVLERVAQRSAPLLRSVRPLWQLGRPELRLPRAL
jgi:hypothetical protein